MVPGARLAARDTDATILTVRGVLSAFIALTLLGATSSARQQPAANQPTFRARADYVEVDAFVTDAQGHFVRNLGKNDFTVLEDGKRVPLSTVDLIDLPRSPAASGAAAPTSDVTNNAVAADGRVYFIVLDDLHVEAENSPRARRTALDFVEHNVGANDLAAIIRTSGRTEGSQDLTSNRRALTAAIDQFVGQKTASPAMATSSGNVPIGLRPGENSPLDIERENQARASLESLGRVLAYARSLQGRRKALIMISEGMDFDLVARTTSADVRQATYNLIDAANRAMLSIYTIDPRGVSQGGEHAAELAGTGASQAGLQDAVQTSTEGLRTLAAGTGGRFFLRSSNVAAMFAAIDDASSTYYLLTYSSPAPEDGKLHSIEVRLARSDLKVLARKGYVRVPHSPPPSTRALEGLSPELDSALADPRSATKVRFSVGAAVFRGITSPSVSVLIHIPGSAMSFAPVDGKMRAQVEVAVLAFDATGRSRNGDRTSLQMDLSPENHERAKEDGIVVPFRFDLSKGRYQLHVGVRDLTSGQLGTVRHDIDVPDFGGSTLSFSSLVLAASDVPSPPFVRAATELQALIGQQPTLVREFTPATTLTAATEAYLPGGIGVAVTAEVRTVERQVVRTTAACRLEPGNPSSNTVCAISLPLAAVPPGTYSVRFAAEAAGKRIESAPVFFAIR